MELSLNLPFCVQSGDCGVCDILTFVGSIFELLIVILAAGAFIMLIIGSAQFVLSRGNPETRKKGIQILTSVVAGVFIGLLAWQIVNLTIFILVGNNKFEETGQPVHYKIFDNPWNAVCGGESFRDQTECLDNNNEPKPDETECGVGGACKNGICIGSKIELAECLGKSDGSPCNNGYEHCLNGACVAGDSCAYLADTPKFAGKFGGTRKIAKSSGNYEPLKKYQCVKILNHKADQYTLDDANKGELDQIYPKTLEEEYKAKITLDCLESLCPVDLLCCGEIAGLKP